MKKSKIVALGELLIDFTAIETRESSKKVFERNAGGAPANLLSCLSKFGCDTYFIGKVGNDMHGRFLIDSLKRENINTDNVVLTDDYFTTLAFVDLDEKGERSFSFARKPGADTQLAINDISKNIFDNKDVFHFGSISLTHEPSETATKESIEHAKNENALITFDPNYREKLWESKEVAIDKIKSVLGSVNILKVTDEELFMITNEKNIMNSFNVLEKYNIDMILVTLGSKGSFAKTKHHYIHYPAKKISNVVDTTGAGDSFFGGALYKLLELNVNIDSLSQENIEEILNFGNTTASLCIQKRGALESMPSYEEVLNNL